MNLLQYVQWMKAELRFVQLVLFPLIPRLSKLRLVLNEKSTILRIVLSSE
jgi:hypothetical protein